MEINFLALLTAAASTLVVGFVYYHPKVFGNAWMKASGLTEDKIKTGNMALIFGLALIFAFLIAFMVMPITIHQFGVAQLIGGDVSQAKPSYHALMADYGNHYRTFKHGALHGFMIGVLLAFPIIATNGLFERKSWRYILINAGFWIICLTLIAAIVCGWE